MDLQAAFPDGVAAYNCVLVSVALFHYKMGAIPVIGACKGGGTVVYRTGTLAGVFL